MIYAKVLADSIGPHGVRITTMELEMPRFILAQFNTHRAFSRNASSSRAVPVDRLIARAESDPFVPDVFGANQRGMQAAGEVKDSVSARETWLKARDAACYYAKRMQELGVHKQLANRLIEPFAWAKVLVTATEWDNFFALRIDRHAQDEMRQLALEMRGALKCSTPAELKAGEWHVPFGDDCPEADRLKVATARCARISYLTHDGQRDPARDLELHDKLRQDGHFSPFEHCAKCWYGAEKFFNLTGWASYRFHLEQGIEP